MKLLKICLVSSELRELEKPINAQYTWWGGTLETIPVFWSTLSKTKTHLKPYVVLLKVFYTYCGPSSPLESHHESTHAEEHGQEVHVLGHWVLALLGHVGLVTDNAVTAPHIVTCGGGRHG